MKKPVIIILIGAIFFLTPPFMLIFNASANMVPLLGPGNIFTRMATSDFLFLFLYPLCGIAILSLRPWGWKLFIASAAAMVLYNLASFIRNPFVSLASLLIYDTLLLGCAGFFFRRHVIAPYFNPRLHWWKQANRYHLKREGLIWTREEGIHGIVEDFSLSGCFFRCRVPLRIGAVHNLELNIAETRIALQGRVMRSWAGGYGLMFINLSGTAREGLLALEERLAEVGLAPPGRQERDQEKRKAARYPTAPALTLIPTEPALQTKFPVQLADISRSGCRVFGFENHGPLKRCRLSGDEAAGARIFPMTVVWQSGSAPEISYGLALEKPTKAMRKEWGNLVSTIRNLNGTVRARDEELYEEMINATLPGTPYRWIRRAANRLRRSS